MRPHRSETDCSPTFHPNRLFLGVTVALSALSAGVLYLGSQLVSPSGLRQLTPTTPSACIASSSPRNRESLPRARLG